MAIFSVLITFIARQASRIVNVIFGWTTTMLFGKLPASKQIWLSVITLGAVAWLAALVGTVFPSVGTFLLAFAPIPAWVDRRWVQLGMLLAAILIPLIMGSITTFVLSEPRPDSSRLLGSVLRGYPYTVGLAVTVILMFVFVPFLKIPAILRRWEDQHLPVTVPPTAYEQVVVAFERALDGAGLESDRVKAPALMRLPPKILAVLAGGPIENLVAENLVMLRDRERRFEMVLFPSDLMVRGESYTASRARAAIVKEAAFSRAYMTWTREGSRLESNLLGIWGRIHDRAEPALLHNALRDLDDFDRLLSAAQLAFEEWETLYRERLQLEQVILKSLSGLAARPAEGRDEERREQASAA